MLRLRGPTSGALLLILPCLLEAQQVNGRVREEITGVAVAAALVILVDSTGSPYQQVLTDSLGLFSLRAPRAGTYRLAVERIGYSPVSSEPVELAAQDSAMLELYVSPDAVRLEPVVVRDRPASRLDFFHERRRRFEDLGIGDFFDRAELEPWMNHPVSAVLQSIPYLRSISAGIGRIGSRSRRCQIGYYMDGVRLRSLFGQSVDDLVRIIDLEGIEVYRGQAQLPAEYSDPQSRGCPVVAFWTRRTD